jgi:purine-binding chemotaxis protein CheW
MSQFATFHAGEHLIGLDILSVRDIIRVFDITPVPRTDDHIRGLINLRGQIVTILDLAVRLGQSSPPITDNTHIVILKAAASSNKEDRSEGSTHGLLGLLVDAIGDVVLADDSRADMPPANLAEAEERFLSGVLKTDAGLLVLLNLRELLSTG